MNNKAHDIFLLMLNLSQFKTIEKMIDFFLDAMNAMWDGLTFHLEDGSDEDSKRGEPGEREEGAAPVFKIATPKRCFGLIRVAGKHPGEKDMALIRNAVRMLAIVLENREQDKLLSNEKTRLEAAVRERTEELVAVNEALKQKMNEQQRLENQLLQAHKMEAIGTLAGGIAHDFNNILGAVMGYTELSLMKLEKGSKVYANLEKILAASNRAKTMVSQILTFSRRTRLERKPIRLEPIIDETMTLLRGSLPSTIEINKEIEPSAHAVLANSTQVQQVLMNLCTNAAHAMKGHEHHALLEVSLGEVDITDEGNPAPVVDLSSGRYLRLSVSDTGGGIDPDIKERIFDPFFSTKSHGDHSGMGLAVVHGIVKSYGGDIQVDSSPGEGTVFHVFLPAVEVRDMKENAPQNKETGDEPRKGNERILFVDDEVFLTDVARLMLENSGYRVTAVNNSVKALNLLRVSPDRFDLIITDQTMPRMTGVQLAKRAGTIRRDIPIILCTGLRDTMDSEQIRAAGIRAFVGKPYTQAKLLAAVAEAFKPPRPQDTKNKM